MPSGLPRFRHVALMAAAVHLCSALLAGGCEGDESSKDTGRNNDNGADGSTATDGSAGLGGEGGEAGIAGAGGMAGSAGVGGTAATGGSAGEDATGGSGGTGGAPEDAGVTAIPAAAIAPGGTHMQSPNFKMIVSTGESPSGNRVMSSPGYQLRTGIPGVVQ